MDDIVSVAKWEDRRVLSKLWAICFHENQRAIRFFFNNAFQPENCLVYRTNGKIAAMLHMLPARIVEPQKIAQAHYIYGAATFPQYQKRGYMGILLKTAAEIGKERGDKYSFLLPASFSLYQYYAKFDYIPAFSLKRLTVTDQRIKEIVGSVNPQKFLWESGQVESFRNQCLLSNYGSVLWDKNAIFYASGINRVYGGKILYSIENGKKAYALCGMRSDNLCEVTEIMADIPAVPGLLANLIKEFPAKQYCFRLPENSNIFPEENANISHFGMVKLLFPSEQEKWHELFHSSYLGLTLD